MLASGLCRTECQRFKALFFTFHQYCSLVIYSCHLFSVYWFSALRRPLPPVNKQPPLTLYNMIYYIKTRKFKTSVFIEILRLEECLIQNDKFKTTIHTPVIQYIVLSGGKNVSIREKKMYSCVLFNWSSFSWTKLEHFKQEVVLFLNFLSALYV